MWISATQIILRTLVRLNIFIKKIRKKCFLHAVQKSKLHTYSISATKNLQLLRQLFERMERLKTSVTMSTWDGDPLSRGIFKG